MARDSVVSVAGTTRQVTYQRLLTQADVVLVADDAAP